MASPPEALPSVKRPLTVIAGGWRGPYMGKFPPRSDRCNRTRLSVAPKTRLKLRRAWFSKLGFSPTVSPRVMFWDLARRVTGIQVGILPL